MNQKKWLVFMNLLNNKKFLYSILLLAFLLRFPGIFDGLPAVYNSTEYYHAKLALSMGARKSLDPQITNYSIFNPRLFIYPMLYEYMVLAQYVLLFIFGKIFSVFKDSYDYAVRFLIDPSPFYLTNRFFNVLISTGIVFSFYTFLRKIYNEIMARFAAIISAVSYYLILAAIQGVSDSLLIFFSTLTTLYILRSYFEPLNRNFILAAIFAGLAIATKYNAGVLLIMFPLLIWVKKAELQNRLLKISILSGITIIVVFLIPNPYWVIRFSQFVEGYQLVATQANLAISPESGINYWWEFSQIAQHELLIGIGFFISILYFLFKKQKEKYILLVMVIITFLYVGSWQKKGIDYLYAIYPTFILLLSMWCYNIWLYFDKKPHIRNIIFLLFFVPSVFMGIYQNIVKFGYDTREMATQWIIENVNKSDKICYDSYHYDLGLFDINRFTKYGAGASQLPNEVVERLEEYRNHPGNFSMVPILEKIENPPPKSGNLYEVEQSNYSRKSLDQLKNRDVKYVITNDWYFKTFINIDQSSLSPIVRKQAEIITNFYGELFLNSNPVATFTPNFWRPGPEIKIYSLN